jgi:chromate reductase, NAD(P)H dehydrogenase (quinone)
VTTIVGIAGSLRRGSYNLMLLRAAADVMPEGVSLEIASIGDIPLYNADVEAEQGIPAPVQRLKDRIAAADGLLIVTPEYNNAMPGVLKNALDWLSRPPADIPRVFRSLPTGVIGATPGLGGTILSQASWLPVLRVLGVLPWFEGRVIISGAGKVFDEGGRIVDAGTSDRLRIYTEGFAAFVQQRRRPRP